VSAARIGQVKADGRLRQEQAQGILIAALGILAAHGEYDEAWPAF
jgi:hypothetical protein